MNCYSTIAASPPPTSGGQPQNPMGSMWIMLLLMFVMMYFLIIRPNSKKRKDQEARVASLVKGDKIVSIGGLHGTVHHVGKTTITVKLAENVFVPFDKQAIATVTKTGNSSKRDSSPEPEDSGEES